MKAKLLEVLNMRQLKAKYLGATVTVKSGTRGG